MDGKILDLKLYKNKGVTVIVTFDKVTAPFLVVVNDVKSDKTLYYRTYDKSKLTFNLPKHSDTVKLVCNGTAKIKSVLFTPIKKFNLKYSFNKDIVVPRNYSLQEIKTVFYPQIIDVIKGQPTVLKTPARFVPALKEKQVSIQQTEHLPEPVLEFILDHEEGHYFYGRPYMPDEVIAKFPITPIEKSRLSQFYKKQIQQDELEADRYALYKFINKGYNFSGALNSLLDNLGNDHFSTQRIASLYSEIDKQHKLNEL